MVSALAIWQAVQAVFSFIAKHWKWALIAFLVLYAAVQKAESRHWHKKADNAVKALSDQAAAYTAAQNAATARAEAEKAATEQRNAANQKEHDDALNTQLADARAKLAAYARLHPATAQGGAGSADLRGTAASPEVADGAGQAPLMVTADDALICTENSVRLQNARDWALKLSTPDTHP